MTSGEAGRLVASVVHARSVPMAERERFAPAARAWASSHEGVAIETCHRVEAYAVVDADGPGDEPAVPAGGRRLVDDEAVRHAISVAVGRDSVVVGEDQVLHQLRATIGGARSGDALDPRLERLFAVALRAGRRARSWRTGPTRSLADSALEAIERQAGPLAGRAVLIVGAGQMGALAARSARAAGAGVTIVSRTPARAAALAARLDVAAAPIDPGDAALHGLAGVIVAMGGPWAISAATAGELAAGGAVVVDLSVPSAVPDTLAAGIGPRFISVDALAASDQDGASAPRDAQLDRLDRLIDASAAEYLDWFAAHGRRAAARALAEHAEIEREAELTELWRRMPRLDPEARQLIDGMTRHLASRLLREPLERLGHDPDGRHERAARELFGL